MAQLLKKTAWFLSPIINVVSHYGCRLATSVDGIFSLTYRYIPVKTF